MSDTPGQRLSLVREKLGLTQREMASELSFSQGMVGFLESGKKLPSRNFLQKLAERFGVSSDWLLNGQGEMIQKQSGFAGQTQQIDPPDGSQPMGGDFRVNGQGFALVRRFNVSASAGNGLVAAEPEESEQVALPLNWLRRHNLTADLCGLVEARGDSMKPIIQDGSLLLVDFRPQYPIAKGIHVIRVGEEVLVKELMPVESNGLGQPTKLLLLSANNAVQPRMLEEDELGNSKIIGRVAMTISHFD